MTANPYDEVPYPSQPIEWTAPERLALASFLHGGPRPAIRTCRVLELGCGDGTNLLALARDRPAAYFMGVDGSARAIAAGEDRLRGSCVANVTLRHADLLHASSAIEGSFDYVIVHGVLSWVPDDVRDAILQLAATRARPGGLVYLNYKMSSSSFAKQSAQFEKHKNLVESQILGGGMLMKVAVPEGRAADLGESNSDLKGRVQGR